MGRVTDAIRNFTDAVRNPFDVESAAPVPAIPQSTREAFDEITLSEFFMGRDKSFADQLTPEIIANATATCGAWNRLLRIFFEDTGINHRGMRSGWRPPAVNAKTPGAATNSKHMTGEAADLEDPDKKLAHWVKAHPEICSECGLWFEDPFSLKADGTGEFTPTWVHGQIVPPHSGRRFYIPA